MAGIKHLIECHCYLVIYKNNEKIINHKFSVYSKFDNNNKIIKKLAKCNNCEALHNIIGVGKSEIYAGKDQTTVTLTIDDIAMMIPVRITNVLRASNIDISDWEHALDIINEKRWGEYIVLKRDIIGERQQVKVLEILSENKFKLSTEIINDIIIGE
jgi:hypothetical protein